MFSVTQGALKKCSLQIDNHFNKLEWKLQFFYNDNLEMRMNDARKSLLPNKGKISLSHFSLRQVYRICILVSRKAKKCLWSEFWTKKKTERRIKNTKFEWKHKHNNLAESNKNVVVKEKLKAEKSTSAKL